MRLFVVVQGDEIVVTSETGFRAAYCKRPNFPQLKVRRRTEDRVQCDDHGRARPCDDTRYGAFELTDRCPPLAHRQAHWQAGLSRGGTARRACRDISFPLVI